MAENNKRFRIEFTVDAEGWSDKFIKDSAIQELTCMVPFPEDITFSDASPWHTGIPIEEGWYLIAFYPHNNSDNPIAYQCCEYKNGEWHEVEKSCNKFEPFIEAWQKITPFEANPS